MRSSHNISKCHISFTYTIFPSNCQIPKWYPVIIRVSCPSQHNNNFILDILTLFLRFQLCLCCLDFVIEMQNRGKLLDWIMLQQDLYVQMFFQFEMSTWVIKKHIIILTETIWDPTSAVKDIIKCNFKERKKRSELPVANWLPNFFSFLIHQRKKILKASEATVDGNSARKLFHKAQNQKPTRQRLFWSQENTTKSSLVLLPCNHIRLKSASTCHIKPLKPWTLFIVQLMFPQELFLLWLVSVIVIFYFKSGPNCRFKHKADRKFYSKCLKPLKLKHRNLLKENEANYKPQAIFLIHSFCLLLISCFTLKVYFLSLLASFLLPPLKYSWLSFRLCFLIICWPWTYFGLVSLAEIKAQSFCPQLCGFGPLHSTYSDK